MISRLFQGVHVGVWAEISALVFFVTFLMLLAWVYLPQRRAHYEREERLPLEDEVR